MAEYINREALIERLKFKRDCVRRISHYPGLESAISQVKKAPAADVAPVVHGHWVLLDECSNAGVYCSVCHKKVYKECYANCKPESNYCPNCGAKMDGGKHG